MSANVITVPQYSIGKILIPYQASMSTEGRMRAESNDIRKFIGDWLVRKTLRYRPPARDLIYSFLGNEIDHKKFKRYINFLKHIGLPVDRFVTEKEKECEVDSFYSQFVSMAIKIEYYEVEETLITFLNSANLSMYKKKNERFYMGKKDVQTVIQRLNEMLVFNKTSNCQDFGEYAKKKAKHLWDTIDDNYLKELKKPLRSTNR